VLLLGVLGLAAWLRVRGLSFGLPATYNPDEVAILSRALAFATGDLNPHNFLYPTFFFYALFAWLGACFVLGWVAGAVESLAAFQTAFFVDPSSVYLAGRSLGVVCGVAAVGATWWLARRLFGTGTAIAAALFAAVAPIAVRDAHYIKHDVPVTLAIVAAMIAMARIWPGAGGRGASEDGAGNRSAPARAELLWAGGCCGLAFSTHYYAVFLAAPLAIAIWRGTGGGAAGRRLAALAWAGAAVVAVFFALSPFLLVEPATVWRDITANRQIVVDRSGAGLGRPFPSAGAYARLLWAEAAGWPVALLAAWGTWILWRLSKSVTLWLLAFPVLFLGFISHTVAASRYLNPVLPFVALLSALAVHDLAARLWPRHRAATAAAIAALSALPGLIDSHFVGRFFRQDDTRTLARRVIEARVPAGSTILLQPYSVQPIQSRESLVEALTARLGDPARASTRFRLRLALDPWPSPAYRTLYLGEGGLDADKIYVPYGDFAGERAAATFERLRADAVVVKRYPVDDPATEALRAALGRQARLIQRVSPYASGEALPPDPVEPFEHNADMPLDRSLERPGPIVEVWTLR
jgi:hypothetical protein